MAPSFVQAALLGLLTTTVYGGAVSKRADVPTVLPGTWKYQGCYQDGAPRTLGGPAFANNTGMTARQCIAFCDKEGYIFAGTEYSEECYCGNNIVTGRTVAPKSECDMPCAGNATEACGGPNRVSVYWNGEDAPPGPTHNTGVLGFGFMGCYTEGTTGRALGYQAGFTGDLTITKCVQACRTAGYTMAGAEYANECFCGNDFQNTPSIAPDGLAACNMPCKGNSSEYCGAGNRLNIYKQGYVGEASSSTTTTRTTTTTRAATTTAVVTTGVATTTTRAATTTTTTTTSASAAASQVLSRKPVIGAYSRLGCYSDAVGARVMNGGVTADFAAQSLTKCATTCAGSAYFGVEYGGECWCSSALAAASQKMADEAASQVLSRKPVIGHLLRGSFICPGDQYQYCGAGDRLELYKLTSLVSSSSGSPSGTSTTTRAASTSVVPTTGVATTTVRTTTTTVRTTTTTAVPTQSGLPTGWKYTGCYSEGTGGRALSYQQPGGPTNNVQNCINRCISLGYKIAGLEYSEQCFCDNFLYNGAAPIPEARCNMACTGNPDQKCGAGDVLSLYNTGTLVAFQPPKVQTTNLPGSWEYDGCWTDAQVGSRALIWQIISQNNTATSCLSLCSKYGYMSGGMQYGEECYCGDHDAMIAAGSTKRPDSECNIACTGNKEFICGGGNRNSYYRWTGAPLYSFAKPTGPAAGSYEFFIPGVVIPLITTLGINDKVVFMEKSGTGAPNTTGTYELDLTRANDYVNAWRPLHVKTDIFCAAGVTLPDKAGRQLNVGGWSGRSTYGVRLYTPDGSEGVPGKNDWEENNAAISLLDGRWYPSAINLANGSVFVIGGETGSNADPTPTCEILPLPAGGYSKYLDWLERTDPNNLYPFLWVLPSGGIFVMYYNEARILDERTFDTVKMLPNMPGSVNNDGAGRTYPLEGTGVMMPLYPPYTAPATFMACGGSTEGAGLALDNCVSVQPEVANPQYTIERMPSKRVMSCIAALPDGTYLILNGAYQGVAGFGLATGPNLGAVLYDPSKAVGARMSIMANTIVARMYHSEATLLPDGRVLVSGSNPEDGKNPEEYRVEVFNPPYALSGQAPPTFTINKKDWAYGDASTIKISASIPSGNLGAVRVSMMAAVSSTHGNSMGQRTLFLTVSCTGPAATATCAITSPPSSHVAPPGWYQIFLLDGARPGRGKWIRIGGAIADAAGIGNWPANVAGMTPPGLGPVV